MNKNTLIILDWDDTLFPSSWIITNKINLNKEETRQKYIVFFAELDRLLYKFIKKAMAHGKVIIVTNALPIWVKTSLHTLPNTQRLLTNTKIVSARKLHQSETTEMMEWKKRTFKDEVSQELQSSDIINIISIGDGDYEYKALIDLYKWNNENIKLLKSVKLMSKPSYDVLIDQLDVVYKAIDRVCTSDHHLDLKFMNISQVTK
jgi:hypothetical protein